MTEGPRLERPPSDRYGQPEPSEEPAPTPEGPLDRPSPQRGLAFGLIGAGIGGAILAVFGGAFAYSAGLLVVCFFLGRIVGYMVRAGALDSLSSSARVSIAVLLSVGAITVAQVVIWLWALTQGGTLGFAEFLLQTFGPLVPLEYMVGTITAWWSAR